MYRSSARLVKYLADEYDIPLDMQHIFGHDQIPGVTPANVAGMHWDPGPYWNWEHYFQLLGAPLNAHTLTGAAKDLVRILPGFEDNVQPVTSCTTARGRVRPQGTNFVYLHHRPVASRRRWSTTSAATPTARRRRRACPTSAPAPRRA